jgi:hypothetical protein
VDLVTNKTVKVTRAQVRAAKLIVNRASRGIGVATPALKAIANAKPSSMAVEPKRATVS